MDALSPVSLSKVCECYGLMLIFRLSGNISIQLRARSSIENSLLLIMAIPFDEKMLKQYDFIRYSNYGSYNSADWNTRQTGVTCPSEGICFMVAKQCSRWASQTKHQYRFLDSQAKHDNTIA